MKATRVKRAERAVLRAAAAYRNSQRPSVPSVVDRLHQAQSRIAMIRSALQDVSDVSRFNIEQMSEAMRANLDAAYEELSLVLETDLYRTLERTEAPSLDDIDPKEVVRAGELTHQTTCRPH